MPECTAASSAAVAASPAPVVSTTGTGVAGSSDLAVVPARGQGGEQRRLATLRPGEPRGRGRAHNQTARSVGDRDNRCAPLEQPLSGFGGPEPWMGEHASHVVQARAHHVAQRQGPGEQVGPVDRVLCPDGTTHMSIEVVTAADRASSNSRTSPAPARSVSRGSSGR